MYIESCMKALHYEETFYIFALKKKCKKINIQFLETRRFILCILPFIGQVKEATLSDIYYLPFLHASKKKLSSGSFVPQHINMILNQLTRIVINHCNHCVSVGICVIVRVGWCCMSVVEAGRRPLLFLPRTCCWTIINLSLLILIVRTIRRQHLSKFKEENTRMHAHTLPHNITLPHFQEKSIFISATSFITIYFTPPLCLFISLVIFRL